MTVNTPAAPPLPAELETLLRRLRMPHIRKAAPDVIATATAQRWEPAEVLRVLLAEEAAGSDQAPIRMRRRQSGLPAGKTFDAWNTDASPIPKPTQQALRTLEWIDGAENLCICGPSGTGKSHLAEALGHLAIDRGKPVAWHTSNHSPPCLGATEPTTPSTARSGASSAPTSSSSTTSACSPSPPTPPRRCSESSTPPTRNARSPSPRTSTQPASTN